MRRQLIDADYHDSWHDDGSVSLRWFDRDKAECYGENRTWNGSNMISDATGSQWDHEDLYRTAGGKWVLHFWSQYQGTPDSWTMIDESDAIAWLIAQDHADNDDHPPGLRKLIDEALSASEV